MNSEMDKPASSEAQTQEPKKSLRESLRESLQELQNRIRKKRDLKCDCADCANVRTYIDSQGQKVDLSTRPMKHLVNIKKSLVDRWARARVAVTASLGDRLDNGAERYVDAIPDRAQAMFPILAVIDAILAVKADEAALARMKTEIDGIGPVADDSEQ